MPGHDSARVVLLVGGDLMARERIASTAAHAGAELAMVAAGGLGAAVAGDDPDLIVIDLDAGGEGVLEELRSLNAEDLAGREVLGYFSHVNVALGEAAERAGCRAIRRGRFWSSLPEILASA
jgi:hypothetical protein